MEVDPKPGGDGGLGGGAERPSRRIILEQEIEHLSLALLVRRRGWYGSMGP